MISNFFEESGIDVGIVLLVLIFLVVIYTVLMIYWLIRSRKMFQRYEVFMRGRNAATLEEKLAELIDRVNNLQNQDMANKDVLRIVNRNQVNTYQKTGVKKYNAFEGMGGMASFALALLDLNNNGYIINVIHSRSSCYTYLKEIKDGECEVTLGAEEKAALAQAMKKKDRFYEAEKKSEEP